MEEVTRCCWLLETLAHPRGVSRVSRGRGGRGSRGSPGSPGSQLTWERHEEQGACYLTKPLGLFYPVRVMLLDAQTKNVWQKCGVDIFQKDGFTVHAWKLKCWFRLTKILAGLRKQLWKALYTYLHLLHFQLEAAPPVTLTFRLSHLSGGQNGCSARLSWPRLVNQTPTDRTVSKVKTGEKDWRRARKPKPMWHQGGKKMLR